MLTWNRKPLAFVISLYSALVVALSMAAHAVYGFQNGEHSFLSLVLEHGWHVILIGVLTYLAINAFLLHRVAKPIRELHLKLYAVARGDFQPVQVDTDIKEVHEIADGINLMIKQIDLLTPVVKLEDLSRTANKIRLLAKDPDLSVETQETLLASGRELDEAVRALAANAVMVGDNLFPAGAKEDETRSYECANVL